MVHALPEELCRKRADVGPVEDVVVEDTVELEEVEEMEQRDGWRGIAGGRRATGPCLSGGPVAIGDL